MQNQPLRLTALSICLLLTSCASNDTWKPLDSSQTVAPTSIPTSTWRTIGHSHEDRPIEAVTTGHGQFRLLIVAGIHGPEREGAGAADPLLKLLSQPAFQSLATTMIVRDLNPDGSANRTRGNANGVDLNRNWPASNFRASRRRGQSPLSEPETAALATEMDRFNPDLIIVFHATTPGPFVDADGPGNADAIAFVNAAQTVDPRWRTKPDYTNPPGSLGSYIGLDQNRPILTIEFLNGQDRELAAQAAIAGIQAIVNHRAES